MANFNPNVLEKHIYKNDNITIKVLSFNGITAHAVILDENMEETGVKKEYTGYKWGQLNFKDITNNKKEDEKTKDGGKDMGGSDNLGEAPEFPPRFFTYDPNTNKFEVKDRRGNVISKFDIMTMNGKDGENAYQLWKKGQKANSDTSFDAFLKIFKGSDGKDGDEWTINEEGVWCCNGVPSAYRAVGKDGIDGKSAYEVWAETRPAEDRTPEAWIKFLKGKDGKDGDEWTINAEGIWCCNGVPSAYRAVGKDGINGKSAYEVWAENRPAEDRTPEAWIKFLKGKDGKDGDEWTINEEGVWCCNGVPSAYRAAGKDGINGKSAYEVWAENRPAEDRTPEAWIEFLKGKDGENGKNAFEVWQSLKPDERKDATLSDFFNWMVEQTEKKINAKEGATWVPNIEDGKVIFINNKTGETSDAYAVRGKDGKSYAPKFVDGKLTFIDETGKEITPRHDYRGKSAFDLWVELPENKGKSIKEFFDSLKGEKGDSGLDGIVREAKHSYLDIKDHTCPVQTIDTDLIANINNSAKSPESIVEERIDEIIGIRKEGKETRNKPGFFKRFTWWCAGADQPLLSMCPGDHSKYVGIGTVILFTAIMAWFSSFIALQLVFEPHEWTCNGEKCSFPIWAFIGATFWASMIFFLDRFITNTMYSDGKVTISKEEFLGGLPRILIAIFLGIVISAPLELKIFSDEIKSLLTEDINRKLDNSIKNNDKVIKAKEKIEKTETYYYAAECKLDTFPRGAKNGEDYLKYCGTKRQIKKEGTKSVEPFNYKNAETGKFEKNTKTTKEGNEYEYVPVPEDFNSKLFQKDSIAEENKVAILKNKHSKAENELDSIIKSLRNEINIENELHNKGLYDQLEAMHRIALNEGTDKAFKPIKDKELIAVISIVGILLCFIIWWIKAKRITITNIIVSVLTGVCLFFGFNSLYEMLYYLFTPIGLIMLLFILIDISPVLYKMMLADGVYDNYLQQEKLLRQDKIRLSLARMLRKIDKGELQALSPFIMGKIYQKMFKFSINNEIKGKDYKQQINWGLNTDELDNRIKKENEDVFNTVLKYKKRIIMASYAAWYRDMRDALIGSPDDSEGKDISPEDILFNNSNFEEEKSGDNNKDPNSKSNDSNEASDESSKDEKMDNPSDENTSTNKSEEKDDYEKVFEADESEKEKTSNQDEEKVSSQEETQNNNMKESREETNEENDDEFESVINDDENSSNDDTNKDK